MKKVILLAVMTMCMLISGFSQGISRSETDDFTGEKVITTTWDQLNSSGLSCKNILLFKFRLENDIQFFHLNWISDKIVGISEDATIMFKLLDGKIVKFTNLSTTIASKGGGSTNITCNDKYGVSLILKCDDLSLLGDESNPVEKVRIYTNDGYVDIDIKDKYAKKVPSLYEIFIDEVNGVTDSSNNLKKEKYNW
jgi:hypothetical protein